MFSPQFTKVFKIVSFLTILLYLVSINSSRNPLLLANPLIFQKKQYMICLQGKRKRRVRKMKLNYNYTISNWVKYSSYEIKTVNNLMYILPKENAQREFYNPTELFPEIIPALINIGRVYKEEKVSENVKEMVLTFVNTYGLLGIANIMCLNTEGILSETLYFRTTFAPKNNSQISVQNFMKLFSPTAPNGEVLLTKSENKIKLKMKKQPEELKGKLCRANDLLNLIFSEYYGEPLRLFLLFATKLYNHYKIIDNNQETSIPKILVASPRCTHLSKTADFAYSVHYIFTSLCKSISFLYLQMLAEEKRHLKTCKYCQKVFFATNPKAEFCSSNCRNKFNVYKSRNRLENN